MVGVDKMSYYIRLCLLCFIVMILGCQCPYYSKDVFFIAKMCCFSFKEGGGGVKKNAIT